MQQVSRQRYLFNGPGFYYIDLFKSMSAQERKLFRQHQVAHVKGGLIKDSNNETTLRVNVAPDTWVTRNALRRGKRMFDKHIKEALEGTTLAAVKPKYHDYKVYLNNVMGQATQMPVDAGGNIIPSGEWIYSSYHSEDVDWSDAQIGTPGYTNRQADTFQVMITGTHQGTPGNWSRIGLIKSWFDSRAEPQADDPALDGSPVATDPLVNLFDESDTVDEVINSLNTDNDSPPYDIDLHFGMAQAAGSTNNLQRVAFAATQAGAGSISALNGFSALCGLIEVHVSQGSGTGDVEMILDVVMKGDKI